MPKYKVNGRTFNIPDNEVDLFEADFPEAQLHYQTNDGRKFTIYANERKDFLSDFPDATELGWSETIKEQAKQADPFQPEDNLAQPMYGSMSYQDNIGKPEDNLYYPSPLSEEGRADYEPITAEERSKQEYDMLMRQLNDFDAQNRDFMDTYEAYEKAARYQVNEGGFALDTREREYVNANSNDYHLRKQERDALNERIRNNSYFNQMRMAEADAANETVDAISNLMAQNEAENTELHKKMKAMNALAMNPRGSFSGFAKTKEMQEYVDERDDLLTAKRLYENTAQVYAAPINDGEDILKKFGKGFGQRVDDADFWSMGVVGIADDMNARAAFQKIQDKFGSVKEFANLTDAEIDALLTPSEQLLISAVMDNNAALYARKDNTAGAYEAGAGAADSLMFMAQFLLTGGIGDAATVGTAAHKRLVSWLGRKVGSMSNDLMKDVARGAVKLGVGTAESIGKALVMTPLMPHTYANIADKMMSFDDNGELMDTTDAIISGSIDALIETWSESTGDFVNKILGVPGDITKGIAKKALKNVDFSDWGKAMNAPMMKILRKGGFNGFLGEMGEEFIGNATRSLVGTLAPGSGQDPEALKNFAQWEQLLVTAGSFAPMTIFGIGTSSAQYGLAKRKLANAQSAFESMLREASYTEDQTKFIIDELLGSTDAHLTPERLVANFSPLLRELAFNDRFANNRTQAMQSAVDFMWEIARYRTFDGVYHRQEEQQRNDMLTEIQEGTGREFWTTRLSENAGLDGTAYETDEVRAVEFNDGRVAYVLGGDGVNNTVVYNDGQTGFLSEEQLNEGKANGSIVSDATMGLNDYLTQQVARVRMTEEEQRMFTERNSNIGQLRAQFPQDATVELGTTEAPIQGVARQQTPNGVIVESPAGISQLTWEELGRTIGVEVNPQTDAQMEEEAINNLEIADLQRRREREQRRAQRNPAAEAVLTEEQMVDEAENEGLEKPIPMKADGTVDQTAFWNESPARWAQWKTEQRQDGGAYASTYIQNAIGTLEGQIAESEAAFLAESDFDAKDALEQTINQQKARLAELQDLAMRYMPAAIPTETSTEATAEQTQPAVETSQPAVMADRQKFELDAEYQRRLSLAKTLAEKEMILKEYFEAISAGSMEAVVMNKQNYKQVMKDNGCDENAIERVTKSIKIAEEVGQAVSALHANDKIFVIADYNYTVEQGRVSYVHERQHNITKSNPELIQRVLSLGLSRETLQKIVRTLSGTTFYDNESDEVLADEILSSTMEIAYTFDDFSVTLSKLGLPIELINVLNEINDEQRNDFTLANARRNAIQYDNPQGNSGQNVRDQGEVSGGILGEEGDGSLGDSNRRAESGEPTTGGAEASEEGLQVPVAEVEEDSEEDTETILNEDGFEADEQNEDVRFSVRYLPTPEQREGIIDSIIQITGRTREEAERWLESELSLVPIVLNDKEYLDYAPDSKYKAIKDNSDYPQGTVDFNNICRKRKDFTRMYTRLQRAYPNRIFTAEDLADIRAIMSEDGLVVACGLCYVEDRRQKLGEVADEFIKDLQDGFKSYGKKNATKRANAEKFRSFVGADTYIPSIYDLITLEGSDKLHDEHKGIWDAFGAYNRARGQQTQNTFQGYAEYKREILTWSDAKVKKVNSLGGLRIFSYSDFEAHHLLDIIQIIIDCAARGVMIQGYTKVPEFARVVEKTGIKLNRSLIPLGDTGIVDGKLAYDPVEGIDINDPNFLESNDNVGNILIGINDEQIRMAMADPFIHYIIPYHARQAGNIRAKLNVGAWTNYIDTQNERKMSDGKRVEKNINIYTDVLNESITNDREFVEKYLEVCREKGYIPKFDQFLDKDAEGNYVYTPGYYKFLVDFKLFDEAGNILPQKPVVAQFDDAFNAQVLLDYAREERETAGEAMNSTYDKIVETLDLGEPTVGEDVRFSESEGPIDLVEEAKKADIRHRIAAEGTLVPGHKKGRPMLSDAEMMADVSFRITKNTKSTIETWFKKAGVDEEMTEATINYLDYAFEDTTEQLCAAKWYLNGKISLPDEDEYKVRDAVKVAKQNKVDALSYASPMDILNTFGQPKSKVKPIDPDTIKEFSNKKELAEGIVVYDVQDDFEGQAAVRKIIDTHWGEDANPWCLAARTNGDLERAKDMWLHYSKYPKRIAFRNGKLLAFYASANDKTWWDRNDEPHTNIPYSVKSKEGEYEVSTNYELKEGNKKAKKVSVGKSDKKGRTAYFVGNRLESAGIQDGERNLFYSSFPAGATLSDSTYGVGRSIEIQYGPYKNVTQISFERRTKDEPTYYVRVGYGNNGVRAISFVEGARSWDIRYGINGDQIFVGRAQLNFDLTNELSNVYSGAYHMYRINDEEYEIARGTKKVGIVKKGEKVTMQMLEAFGEDGAPAGALLDFINDMGWNRSDYPYPNPVDADLLRRDDEVREQIRKVENEINEIAGGRYLSSVPAIRFRITPEQDKAYMDAVKAGDIETAQRMVIEAARLAMPNTKVVDENGNPKVVYHGSTAMFTIFDKSRIGSATGTADGRGFYFTTDRDYALGYKTPDGQLFEVFLNIEKPLSYDKKTITKAQLRKILKEADRVEYEQEGEHYMLSNYANYNDVGIDGAVNEGANLEYDYADNDVELVGSLIGGSGSFDLIMDAVKKVTGKSGMIAPKDNGTIHYVVTDPAGIKSAEPVTYDDKGNVIPLSERFNPENEDIRFRVTEEQRDEVQFRVISDALYEEMDDMIESLVGASFFRRVEGEFDLGKKVKNFAEFADLITIIKNNDNYISTGSSLLGFFSSHTDQHFPLLLSVDDKALRKQAEADLKEALSQIDDTYILFYIKEAWKAHKNGLAQAGLGVKPNATAKFNKAIDARIEEIRAGRVKGTSFNFKKQEVSLDEIDTLFKQLNTNEELAVLHDKVMGLAKRFGIKPQFAAIRGAAEGESLGDKVRYDYRAFNSPAISDERKANIITHELIHSVTSYAFYLDDYMPNALTPEMREAINILREVYYAIRRDSSFKDEYGASSVEEMVAELSNTAFREKLKEKSLYQRILDAILKLLGVVKEDSAYNAANEALTYIIENYDENAFNLYARQAARSQEYSKWYNSEDVRFRMSNENQAIFVSNAARAVEGIKQEKATPEQWLKMLEKAGGLKAGEDKWMGLSDWLKASDKKTLTKAEVLDFINENMIIIEEQHYSNEEVAASANKELNEKYPGWEEAFSMDWDGYMDEPYASIWDNETAVELYNNNHEDQIELDEDGEFENLDDESKVMNFGKELAEIFYRGNSDVRPIHGIRSDYQTRGLSDNHEIALTVPTIERWKADDAVHFGDAGDGRAIAWIRFGETKYRPAGIADEIAALDKTILEYEGETSDEEYKALVDKKHALLRASRAQKVLVIDEIQSNRHQEGRKRGYKDIRDIRAVKQRKAEIEAEIEALAGAVLEGDRKAKRQQDALFRELRELSMQRVRGEIPDAPFEKNWAELSMKRMLRYAAENGFDIIAWTTGDQQADRYDLSRDVIKISAYRPNAEGERIVSIYYRDEYNDYKTLTVDRDGKVIQGDYNGSALADVVGKGMALQIMNAEDVTEFEGDGLKIGGEGMRGFYDKMLPAFMRKYGKKWGVKVEDINLPNLGKSGYTMHSVPVTEEMKSSVMEGQVMFRTTAITPEVQEEMDAIHASAIVMGNFMKAPNGQPTNLTEEQWLMVRTKGFKEWFGDWINDPENASKVVDKNGEPKVVFHGGAWRPLLEEKGNAVFKMRGGLMGKGAYFTDTLSTAIDYAREKYGWEHDEEVSDEFLDDNGYVTEVFLNIRNEDNIREYYGETFYLATSPNQIKSATDNTGEFSEGEGDIRFKVVTNPSKIEELESGPKIKVYRAMQLIDGKLYPPMSAKVDGQLREPIELGQWEEAEERPDLADNKGYFKLDKGNKKSLKARYNPYFHTSPTPLNDQFSSAQSRPELVTVEVEIPASELTSGYKAEKAKDGVGKMEWKAGVVQSKLSGTRTVILSRWDKPIRIVPDSEVADEIVKMFEGKDIVMPSNVVTPSLRAELEKRGVPFAETDNKGKPISEFGPIYEQFRGKPKEAVEFLMEKKTGEAVGALNHKDIGDISIVYGNEKAGLKKIAVKHPEVLDILQDILDDATIVQQSENRIKLESGRYFAVISKDYLGKPRAPWLLTSFEKKNSVPDNTMDTGETSKGSKQNDTATLQDTVSESKDSDNIDTSNELDENTSFRVTGTPTEDVVAEGVSLSPAQLASLAGDIFTALPEESRKKITDGLNGNILGLQDAILQIPTSLATKENWNDEDRQMAEVIAEQMTKAVGIEMTRPFSASEALWTLYNAVNKSTDLVSEASRALVRRNLGFDSQTLEMEKEARDGVRFRTVGNASANAQASMYNRGAANVRTRLKESFFDMYASAEELVKAIEKRSGKVAEGFENILMALNQQSSRGLAAMEEYERKFLNKMFDEIRDIMNKTDFKYEDIVRYVILKHGLERNVKMAQRDAKAHYQEIYDDIIAKIKGMNPAQKRTYLTNAQLRDADAKAELARLQAVNTSALTPDQLRDHKKELAKAKKETTEAAEHLVRAQKIATMTEQDAQDELDKIFDNINNESDSVYKEMRKNDYSGISSMFYDTLGVDRKNYATEEEYQAALMQAKADKYDALGDIEGAAQMEVTLFENAVNTDNLWKSINKATKETLRQQYEANMISKDQYENLRNMFEFYVPLRGFADNTAEDMYTYYRRPNSTGYTKPILGAEGRKTEAESPFGWIAAMAGSAIASNVKNEAKLALYYFVANRPDNGIATLSKTWFVHTPGDVDANGKKIFRPAYPPFNQDLSTDAAKQAYEDWQEQMRDLQKQGLAYEAGQRLNLGNSVVNISDTNKPEHIVNVKVGGKDYTIVINGNPRAAQAINGDLNIESSAQDYSTVFGPMLRWMSSVNTSYNPEFWITNMMRDMAFTMMAVNIKEDPAYRRKFKKNYAKAFKVISMVAKNENGTLGNSYIERMYKDFVKYGGVTGYTQIKDSETWEKEIENYLSSNDPASIRNGKAMRGVKSVFHAAHRFGESLEQVSRFAAFLTAVETGKSINEAINDAKEITVNFNRKGSGKMITLEEAKYLTDKNGQPLNKLEQWAVVGISSIAPLGRRMIMFFNAAIQGLNATYQLWKKNKLRSIGWISGYVAVGALNAVLHAMLDDDDDYLDIPQYERRNSLMIGGNGAYFKWALPQEARAFYALGDLAVESVMGRNPHQNVIGEALKISTEILPINPSEGWKAFMPSVAIPFVELALNEDYKGAPIYNEQKWLTEEERKRSTKWSKAYSGTGGLYIGIAKVLNAVTGGDEHDAGLINLQPEKMEHLVQSAFGGTIRTADKFINTIMAAFDPEEDVTVRQFPFLNRILTINDERYKNVHVNDVYDYYAAEAEHAQTLLKQYTKDRDADALKDLRSSDEYKWATIYSKYKKPIKKYQEAIRVADTTNERMELMKQQDELKRKMIKEISDL